MTRDNGEGNGGCHPPGGSVVALGIGPLHTNRAHIPSTHPPTHPKPQTPNQPKPLKNIHQPYTQHPHAPQNQNPNHNKQAANIAQVLPALKPTFITLVVGLLVPKDDFSRPYVDIIREGARP